MGIMKSVRNGVAKMVGAKLREDLLTDYQGDDEPTHKYYRKLGGGRGGFRSAQRDLRSSLQEEQNKQAFKAFLENPFIRRLAKMTAEFIVGNGVSVRSDDPKVQAVLDDVAILVLQRPDIGHRAKGRKPQEMVRSRPAHPFEECLYQLKCRCRAGEVRVRIRRVASHMAYDRACVRHGVPEDVVVGDDGLDPQ